MLHAKFQNHRTSCFGEENFGSFFIIYGRGGHLSHVTLTIYINFQSHFPRIIHKKLFGIDWPCCSNKDVRQMVIYMHIALGVGAVNPLRVNLFINSIIQSMFSAATSFLPCKDFVTISQ